jgi:hypothetical protein
MFEEKGIVITETLLKLPQQTITLAKKEAMGALYCDHHGVWGNPTFRRFGPKLHIKGG